MAHHIQMTADDAAAAADVRAADHASLAQAGQVHPQLEVDPCGALFVHLPGFDRRRMTLPARLPISFVQSHDESELAAGLGVMPDLRCSPVAMSSSVRAARPHAIQRLDRELRLAAQVQRDFLPSIPQLSGVAIDVLYHPAEYVSGDFYDFRRLDADHLGIALVDAVGHGIPAALLTVFVKRALHAAETCDFRPIPGRSQGFESGPIPPREVLSRLNRELLQVDLPECRFVAVAYAVLNLPTGQLQIARGGAPYPLIRRADGEIEVLRTEGALVGVLADANFEEWETRLDPGDCLLLHSDGLDELVAHERRTHETHDGPQQSPDHAAPTCDDSSVFAALACQSAISADRISNGDWSYAPAWCTRLSRIGLAETLAWLEQRRHTMACSGVPMDDLSVLALSIPG
ncbi:MAG: SpoIIE family protein phosphatase [Phycisphaerae bacterium]